MWENKNCKNETRETNMDTRITIQVCSKDRHTEIALMIQGLRTQTYKEWDLLILDDASGTPIQNAHFIQCLLNRIKIEGHKSKIIRNELSQGVCYARNELLRLDDWDNPYILRLDDDVICEPDYLERLVKVLKSGYDIASGVTPHMATPELKRDVSFVTPIINKITIAESGNLEKLGDDCGYSYIQDVVLPAHGFRSCALFKKEVFKDLKYETNLTKVGFREEQFLSLRALWKGFKIGVDTHAKVFHFVTPSGGTRSPSYSQDVALDDEQFSKWFKDENKKQGGIPK